MKYTVTIENNQLIFLPKRGNGVSFDVNDISCFMVSNVHTDSHVPIFINGRPFFLEIKNPVTYGSIIIGFKGYLSKEIQKPKYKEVINKYTYFKIKHIHNVFDIAEKLIDLNINYDNVPLKETLRYTLSNKKFYSKEIFITNSGKTSIMKYVNPDF